MSSLESVDGHSMTQSLRVGRVRSYQAPSVAGGDAEGGRRTLSGRATPSAAELWSSTSLPARMARNGGETAITTTSSSVASLAEPYIRYAASLPTWERVEALSVTRTQVRDPPGEGWGGRPVSSDRRSTRAAGGFPSTIPTLGSRDRRAGGRCSIIVTP